MAEARAARIKAFLAAAGWGAAKRTKLPGDASFRHYERLGAGALGEQRRVALIGGDQRLLHRLSSRLRRRKDEQQTARYAGDQSGNTRHDYRAAPVKPAITQINLGHAIRRASEFCNISHNTELNVSQLDWAMSAHGY